MRFTDTKGENDRIIASEGITNQILITTVADTHSLMTSDTDATTVRIAPRDYVTTDSRLGNITVKDDVSRSESNPGSDGDSSVSIMIGGDVGQEQEDGDVTDKYLTKESDVKSEINVENP